MKVEVLILAQVSFVEKHTCPASAVLAQLGLQAHQADEREFHSSFPYFKTAGGAVNGSTVFFHSS